MIKPRTSTKKRSRKAGLSPGTLVHIGEKRTDTVRITLFDYSENHLEERIIERIEDSFPYKEKNSVTWVNLDGLHQVDILKKIDDHFGIHPLVLEDILNTDQRPKAEDFGEYIFVVLKLIVYPPAEDAINYEQISLIMGTNFVLSFTEGESGVFDSVRDRIRNGKGRIRKMGTDYLIHALMDAIVDNYFIVLEKTSERIDVLEDEVIHNPRTSTLHKIHKIKHGMLVLRKAIWPLREVVAVLQRGESPLIKRETQLYLRDLYDHTAYVVDTIETYRDMIAGMLEIYLSSLSNKLNEVMKVLTIFSAIFIPLTFVAGIYGMNFDFMPELKWKYGYFVVWGIMIFTAIFMIRYFRKRKWL